jgi:CubicO group peptidase (beta-lactamase class C family)
MGRTPDGSPEAGRFQRLVAFAGDAMRQLRTPGVAIGLRVSGRDYYAGLGVTSLGNPLPVTPETLFQVGSVTKTLTATVIWRLIERGKLRLEDPVRRCIPDFRVQDEVASAQATVRHLLNHTAGWKGDYCRNTGDGDDALSRYVASMVELPQLSPVGSRYAYNNAGFDVAGRIVEVITGKPYETAVRELVLDPLEMTHSFFFPAEVMEHRFATGHILNGDGLSAARPWAMNRGEAPDGGLVSTVRDLILYARFNLGDGTTLRGERLLTSESLRHMQSPSVDAGNGFWMGLNWFIHDVDGLRLLRHGGEMRGHCAVLWLAPERGFAFTVLTNSSQGARLYQALSAWVFEQFLNIPFPQPS